MIAVSDMPIRRPHCPFGTASEWPPAFITANSTAEPTPRHSERKVNGATSNSASFIAVQLKPQAKVSPASTHHRRAGM